MNNPRPRPVPLKSGMPHLVVAGALVLAVLMLGSCVSAPPPEQPAEPQASVATVEPDIADLIERGDTAGLQALFKGRDLVGKPGADGRYPLHAAVLKKSSEMVAILLAMGAEPDPLDGDGKTPLRYAVDQGDAASAKVLVSRGASFFVADKAGVSPLDAAIAKGFTASLVDQASIGLKGPHGETAMHVAVDRLSIDSVKVLLALDPDLTARDESGRTPLDSAFLHPASQDSAAIAELLVARNAPTSLDDFSYFIRAVRDTNYARARFADGATVLHEAVRFDHRGYLSFFLERGVPIDARNASGSTALHDAVRLGRIEAAKILLAKGADPNARDGAENTPLHLALSSATGAEAAGLLLASGANPALKDKSGNTGLHLAIVLGYPQSMIETLLAKGAAIDAANADGDTALALAVRRRNTALVTLLAGKGASMFVKNVRGDTPLSIALADGPESTKAIVAASPVGARDDSGDSPYHIALRLKAAPETIAVLHELGLDPSARNNEGDTALHLAARLNARVQGEALISAGSDPFSANTVGATPLSIALSAPGGPLPWFFSAGVLGATDAAGNGPLHYAAMAGMADGAAFIVSRGVPVDARNTDGQTALMLALRKDSTGTVNTLLALGADPRARDASGATALHIAVYWNATECLRLLARSSTDLDPRDYTGKTPLRDAIDKANAAAAAYLLERGASPLARDNSGKTPFHAAARQIDDRFVSALALKSKRVDVRDDSGITPLLEAVYAENAKTVRALVMLGASIHARDSTGESPLGYAIKKGGPMLKAMLDERSARSTDADGRSVLRVILDTKPTLDSVEVALAAGAQPDDRDAHGRAPLHAALFGGFYDIAARLMAAGADPFVRDAEGTTPAMMALTAGDAAIASIFGTNPNAADYLGETALHYAAAAGLEKAAQTLLALGADPAARDAAGETAGAVAARRGYKALATLLGAD